MTGRGKAYLTLIFLLLLAAAGGIFYIFLQIDPSQATWLDFSILYLSIFVFGFASIFFVRAFAYKLFGLGKNLFSRRTSALRQSAELSGLATLGLLLWTKNLFNWVTILLLVLAFSALELYFLNFKHSTQKP